MELLKFPAAPAMNAKLAEATLINMIKEAVYQFSDVITVAQAFGCLDLAKAEIYIYEEAK